MVKKDSLKIEKLKKDARNISIKEGIFARMSYSFGDRYLSPFAIAINSSNALVASLGAIRGLLGPVVELYSSRFLEKQSRKKIMRKWVFFEALNWISFVILAFLYSQGILTNLLPFLLLIFFSMYITLSWIPYPAWLSWMGDITDEKSRGRWFSKRYAILGFVTVILTILSAFFLDFLKQKQMAMIGFMILFFLSFLARMNCYRLFKKKYEPKIKINKKDYFSFWDFLKKAPNNNFGRFTLFRGFVGFSTSISIPLVTIYLLRYLEFSYTIYMIITMAGMFFSMLVYELWGKLSDQYGNYRVLCLSGFLIPIIPILWIINSSPIYLVLVPSLIWGISWAGFDLASRNFVYDNVSAQKRGLAFSYYNLIHGIGVFCGAGVGALLIKYLKISFIEPLILIFLIGSFLRMIVFFVGLAKIKETKHTKKLRGMNHLRKILLKETRPTLIKEINDIAAIKRYLIG
ncbi:MAG: MFS transporter [Nanoarchaeota archaeon]|nr:MFS transporter [Nanoarchaeota archaeon]